MTSLLGSSREWWGAELNPGEASLSPGADFKEAHPPHGPAGAGLAPEAGAPLELGPVVSLLSPQSVLVRTVVGCSGAQAYRRQGCLST